MQFAKDSFFLVLQTRLAGLNPARTVTINGATVPAVLVVENLPPSWAEPQPNTFYIEWGEADVIDGHAGDSALMSLEVVIFVLHAGFGGERSRPGKAAGATGRGTARNLPAAGYGKNGLHANTRGRPGHERVLGTALVWGGQRLGAVLGTDVVSIANQERGDGCSGESAG